MNEVKRQDFPTVEEANAFFDNLPEITEVRQHPKELSEAFERNPVVDGLITALLHSNMEPPSIIGSALITGFWMGDVFARNRMANRKLAQEMGFAAPAPPPPVAPDPALPNTDELDDAILTAQRFLEVRDGVTTPQTPLQTAVSTLMRESSGAREMFRHAEAHRDMVPGFLAAMFLAGMVAAQAKPLPKGLLEAPKKKRTWRAKTKVAKEDRCNFS